MPTTSNDESAEQKWSYVVSFKPPPNYVKRDCVTAACFDGGGVRGIAGAIIMDAIMKKLEERTGKTDIHEFFDVVAGTGTGGFLALLARLGVPIQEIISIFHALSEESLLHEPKGWRLALWGAPHSDTHSERKLRDAVGKYADVDAQFYDESKKASTVLIMATNSSYGIPPLIRADDRNDRQTTILDVARATTAAPIYFPAVQSATGELIVDGGFGHSNITKLVMHEAMKKYGYGVKFGLLLNIGPGTGVTEKSILGPISVDFLRAWIRQRTDSTTIHEDVIRRFQTEAGLGVYVRISIPGIGKFAADDHQAIREIEHLTREYLETAECKEIVDFIVQSLVETAQADQHRLGSPVDPSISPLRSPSRSPSPRHTPATHGSPQPNYGPLA